MTKKGLLRLFKKPPNFLTDISRISNTPVTIFYYLNFQDFLKREKSNSVGKEERRKP